MSPRPKKTTSTRSRTNESQFEYSTLLEFSRIINSSSDLRFILSHILLSIMGKILSPRGMAVLAHGPKKFRVELVKGFDGSLEGLDLTIPRLPRVPIGPRQLSDLRSPWSKRLREEGVSICLPMYLSDEPVGLLAFGERLGKAKVRARELTYLQSLANISATAVQKSHSIAELESVNRKLDRKVQELNTLFELGKEFGVLLDSEKLIRLLVFSLLGQVGVNRYVICIREGADMRIVASRLDGRNPQEELLGSLGRLKNPVPVDEMLVLNGRDPRLLLKELGVAVVVPLHLKGESRGLILLGQKLSGEQFSPGDLEFLSSLGNLAMISLDNARLFQEAIEKQKMEDELVIAREIQKGLLPDILPPIPGIELAAANISSRQVGGDYYDVIPVDTSRSLIAIGDVSGKGTPAALLMANLQAAIRALVPLELSLGGLTGRVNDLMCRNTGGNKFVTFFWGIFDHRTLSLRYVNAGHNYPMLLRSDGTLDRLDRGGMILGVVPTTQPYEEALVQLVQGDILVLFTDGVSEAMDGHGEEYGEARLEAVVRSANALSAQDILGAIHRGVVSHAGGTPQSDDITLMVLRAIPA